VRHGDPERAEAETASAIVTSRTRSRPVLPASVIALVVTSCAIALAACGSTKPATTAASLTPSAATAQRAALRFSHCMRAHRVTNFPDPTANGQSPTSDHVNKRSPAFQTAVQACHPQMTAMVDLKPKTSHAQELREAECMRTHGVPNFPDPLPGGGYDYPGSINPNSPAFQHASNECQKPK
jgi:hypothetical protein